MKHANFQRRSLTCAALLIILLASAVASGSANATPTTQGNGKGNRREALERFRAALEQLDLSAQQKEKIKSIFMETRTKLEALKGQSGAREQAREIIQEARKSIMAQLDETQKAKLMEILKSERSQDKA